MAASYDTRVRMLTDPIPESWEPRVRAQHWENRAAVMDGLNHEYGTFERGRKLSDFTALGPEPFSVLAFHNAFFRQSRVAFIAGTYYPALMGACALGERILNHMMMTLRDSFRDSPEYKRVYRKNAFDNWDLAIDTLEAWGVWLAGVADDFRRLKGMRNSAVHFEPEVDQQARPLALDAIEQLGTIIDEQFGAWGPKPWFMAEAGEIYVKGEWEGVPFVSQVIVPAGLHVGPKHTVAFDESRRQWVVDDEGDMGADEGTDAEFLQLRKT
jgi:hypothetical protein